jgi:hypothetical protein
MISLALKRTPSKTATFGQRGASKAIKARLVSQFSHGGIAVDGVLYHSTAAKGVHFLKQGEWCPTEWDLFPVKADMEQVISRFATVQGWLYDWLSLLAFVGIRARDSERLYCFELCHYLLTGEKPTGRVTPETLLLLALRHRA